MKALEIGSQLYIGRDESVLLSLGAIRTALRRAREAAGLQRLMIWVNADSAPYGELAGLCRTQGIEPWLWFPVLGDAPGLAVEADHLVELVDGGRGHGASGAWEGLSGGEESFLFTCPNDSAAVDRILHQFDSLLDLASFQGVMLDRIRFPSPANGFEALLACFCPACAVRFEEEAGYPLATLRARARALMQRMQSWTRAEAEAAWRTPHSLWELSGLADLVSFRTRSISRVVARLSARARARGLRVGLDLFSPSLATLVGQEYSRLAVEADWIKPMSYCHAVGPAGLPLELASLARGLATLCPRLSEGDALGVLGSAFGWPLPGSAAELLAKGLPARVLGEELETIRRMGLPSKIAVHAGVEAVSIPWYGIDITPAVLGAFLEAAAGKVDGVIASWNLLAIPEANLRLLGSRRN